jgi:uncharacterized NAD(P)/FAD-binding protein YdhS
VVDVACGQDDEALLARIASADKVGIDAPFGWPAAFVDAVARFHAGGPELVVNLVRRTGAVAVIRAHVDEPDFEGRDTLRPDDAAVVMARLDDRAH